MTWQELLDKHYESSVTQSFNRPHVFYTPKGMYVDDYDGMNPYARWIVQHDDGWYVQTGNHRSSMKEGTRYDTLEQAVVVAVALMTLKVERGT